MQYTIENDKMKCIRLEYKKDPKVLICLMFKMNREPQNPVL